MRIVERILATVAMMIIVVGLKAQNEELSKLYNALKSETDVVKMEELVIKMEKIGDSGNPFLNLVDISRGMVALEFAKNKNASKAWYWAGQITDTFSRDNYYLSVIQTLTDANQLDEAEKLLNPLRERYKGKTTTRGQANMFHRELSSKDFESLYGVILYRKGKYKEALKHLPEPSAENKLQRGDTRNAEFYSMALAESGELEKAYTTMYKLLLEPGKRSAEFITLTESVFTKKFGNNKRYNQVLDSLHVEEVRKVEEKVLKMAVNTPAPDFELTDLNGNTVSLKSLRGKTVILDFWATWCQPCVASFPGMQKAVDYYKNDSSVVFMFIHTSEKSEDPVGDVKRFMNNKKYRFNVYMDLRNPETQKSPVAEAFKVRGIPAKFLIDGDGNIRFSNTGYVSEEEAVLEISTMVNSSRKK